MGSLSRHNLELENRLDFVEAYIKSFLISLREIEPNPLKEMQERCLFSHGPPGSLSSTLSSEDSQHVSTKCASFSPVGFLVDVSQLVVDL